MSDTPATVSRQRRISLIWTVPIIALVLGAWMVFITLRDKGPEIRITFSTAEGVEAGKTKVKVRSVDVGIVESTALGDDVESVVITARIDKTATSLLREDSRFWVVRPRIGTEACPGSARCSRVATSVCLPGRANPVGVTTSDWKLLQ